MTAKDQLYASRATEKSSSALYRLATEGGSLTDRLVHAWDDLVMLSGRTLPGKFQEQFDHMEELVTSEGPSTNAGSIENSIRAMSPDEAGQLASLMVAFAVDVAIAVADKRP